MTMNTQKLHTTGSTTKLQKVYDLATDYWHDFRVYCIASGAVLTLITIMVASVLLQRSPTPQLQSVIIVATPSVMPTPSIPTATPVSLSTETRLNAAVVAYDAPNGNVLGPIESDRAYTIVARYGSDWLQADMTGSGPVWIKSDELGTVTVTANLPDLRPTPTAEIVYVVREGPQPAGMATVANAPAPPAVGTQRDGSQPTPIREKPTPVRTEAEQFWTFPTAQPLPRTPGVEVSSDAYEECRRSGNAFGACKHHMPDDYWIPGDE